MNYYEYIKSEGWKSKREWALRLADYKCQVCNKNININVHHRTYENLGNERPGDLIVLCKDCHKLFHDNNKLPEKPSGEELSLKNINTIDNLLKQLVCITKELSNIENNIEDSYKTSKKWNEHIQEPNREVVIYDYKKKIIELDFKIKIRKNTETMYNIKDENEKFRLMKENRDLENYKRELLNDKEKLLNHFKTFHQNNF